MVLWRPTRPSRTNSQKRSPFHDRGLKSKSRKSRDTWNNRKFMPWSTEWSRAKANRILPRERTGHSKHLLPTTQEKTLHMDITRWSIPKSDWLCSLQPKMEKLYTVRKNMTWSDRQVWPWSTEWSRAKANRILPRERTGHSKHPLPTTQEKTLHMDITRWQILKSD